jgi:copper chaperone CopZ
VLVLLVPYRALRTRLRGQTRRPAAALPAAGSASGPGSVRGSLLTAVTPAEPRAWAFPIHDLPPACAAALEGILHRVTGVTGVYVSPVTALAYVDYWPAQVSEDDLVHTIQRAGYGVGAAAQRFDWRHRRGGVSAPAAAPATRGG